MEKKQHRDKNTPSPEEKAYEAPKDLVKNIFERPKAAAKRVSAIFTNYKASRKVAPSTEAIYDIPANIKPLPVAIDIGTTSIKIVRLGEADKNSLQVVCLDKDTYKEEDSDKSHSIKEGLKKLAAQNRVGTQCALTLPSKDTQVYNMLFPPMSDEELEAAVRYKVSQLKPFGLKREEVVFKFRKWQAEKGMPKTPQQRVIVACIPRDTISKQLGMVKELGFHPVSIEIPQFGLLNIRKFYNEPTHKDETIIWIHIGAQESFLSIEKDYNLCFSKRIALTSAQMNKAIVKRMSVDEEKAESLKKEVGFNLSSNKDSNSEKVYYSLVSLLENLVVDIEHSFKYFSNQISQSQITSFSKILITGGGANLKGLDKFLNMRLGVNVERVNPFTLFALPEVLKNQKPEVVNEPATFALCCSIAAGGKIDDSFKVNFLPPEEKTPFMIAQDMLRRKPVRIAAAVIAAGILILGLQAARLGFYKSKMHFVTKSLESARSNVSDMETSGIDFAKEEVRLLQKKEILSAQLDLLKGSFRGRTELSQVFTSITSLLPEEIWVNELMYKDEELLITGSTIDVSLITTLIDKIRESEAFTDVDFNYTQREDNNNVYSFEVLAKVKP